MLDATGHWIGTALRGLQHVERELTLFALFWFLVGLADELAIDCAWAWQRLVRG